MELVTAHRKHSPAERDTGDQYRRLKMKMSDDTCISTNVDENIYANKMDEDVYANADIIKANEAPKGTSNPMEQTSRRSQHSDKGAFNDLEEKSNMLAAKRDQLQTNYSSLKMNHNQLQTNYSSLKMNHNQLQTNYSSLKMNHNQLQTNYSIVKTERDQLASVAQRPRCPSGWISFNFKCYYVSDQQKTWINSQEDCRHKGADLFIINSLKEQLIFSKYQRAWIGLTDSDHEGTWKWVDGTPLTTSYWMTGEPNDNGNEDCVEIITGKDILKNWNDLPCNHLNNWICESGEVN
ncbi:CD209 antigen-like protein C isoform X2 [Brienomyrus brachyistius]|uniref:CD209 antigen-like protein C isoform X2 n=1 Tax=Brienomyrus brachyistius TaxID=42636 RepID=UPI0020B20565|nr:CD209 antigen-like protein C isoform X2 [Brienomyrus brachyistius]